MGAAADEEGRPRRVLVTNCVTLNGGDAAILAALLERLREALGADTRFAVADDRPDAAALLYPEWRYQPSLSRLVADLDRSRLPGRVAQHVNPWRFRVAALALGRRRPRLARLLLDPVELTALRRLAAADAVVATGGTYLVETYWFAPRLVELELAHALGRPVVLFTQSAGPFTTRGIRRHVRRAVGPARLVLLRDARSLRHVRDAGVPERHLAVSADAVFGLAGAPPPPWRHPEDRALRVAVSVRAWHHDRRADGRDAGATYREAMAAVVTQLVRGRGAEVTFVSTCQGAPGYWTDDGAEAEAIADELAPGVRERVLVDRDFHRPPELMARLSRFDLVVATRMHATIMALAAGTPAFPIAYEFKTHELAATLGLERWVRDFAALDAEELPGAVDAFLDALPAIAGPLFARVEAERRRALGATAQLRDALT